MVIRIVETLPDVIIDIEVIAVNVVPHANVREDIFELRVVVIGHCCEWVEEIRVNWFGL